MGENVRLGESPNFREINFTKIFVKLVSRKNGWSKETKDLKVFLSKREHTIRRDSHAIHRIGSKHPDSVL